jgi:hypothetical protein
MKTGLNDAIGAFIFLLSPLYTVFIEYNFEKCVGERDGRWQRRKRAQTTQGGVLSFGTVVFFCFLFFLLLLH